MISQIEQVKARGGRRHRRRHRGRRAHRQQSRPRAVHPEAPALLQPDPHRHPAATAGLPHRRAARLRRGPAAQPGQERDGGVGIVSVNDFWV